MKQSKKNNKQKKGVSDIRSIKHIFNKFTPTKDEFKLLLRRCNYSHKPDEDCKEDCLSYSFFTTSELKEISTSNDIDYHQVLKDSSVFSWWFTKGVYRFDPKVYEALIKSKKVCVSSELLSRIPEWSVYIETPNYEFFSQKAHGFFASICYGVCGCPNAKAELQIIVDLEEGGVFMIVIPLIDGTLQNTILQAWAGTSFVSLAGKDYNSCYSVDQLAPLLSLLLFLCESNADVVSPSNINKRPHIPKNKKILQHGVAISRNRKPTIWHTGFKMGNAIRNQSIMTHKGGTKRPHIRRAHWHHYWKGIKGDAKLITKWISPIAVGRFDGDEIIPTVRDV